MNNTTLVVVKVRDSCPGLMAQFTMRGLEDVREFGAECLRHGVALLSFAR